MNANALLSVDGLTRRFGGLEAVNAVTLDLRLGEVHAVIGTNGAGKSTLINMLSGEIDASEGRITLDGQDITRQSQARRALAGVGRSYQRTTIFPEFTVHENCRLAAQAAAPQPWKLWQAASGCRRSNQTANDALEAAGLGADAHRTAGTLSHGYGFLVLTLARYLPAGTEVDVRVHFTSQDSSLGADESQFWGYMVA